MKDYIVLVHTSKGNQKFSYERHPHHKKYFLVGLVVTHELKVTSLIVALSLTSRKDPKGRCLWGLIYIG